MNKEDRPYIINYMMQTIDGKVTGDWYEKPEAEFAMIDFLEREKKFKSRCIFKWNKYIFSNIYKRKFYSRFNTI